MGRYKIKISRGTITDEDTEFEDGYLIIKLRGRSSFQSPAYNAVKMIEAAMGGKEFTLPAGC